MTSTALTWQWHLETVESLRFALHDSGDAYRQEFERESLRLHLLPTS